MNANFQKEIISHLTSGYQLVLSVIVIQMENNTYQHQKDLQSRNTINVSQNVFKLLIEVIFKYSMHIRALLMMIARSFKFIKAITLPNSIPLRKSMMYVTMIICLQSIH